MLSFYTMTAIWGAVYWVLHRLRMEIRPLRWRVVLLALAPLALDGLTHLLNDAIAGTTGAGFRDGNAWLATLTANAWPAFYGGDHVGTFNWWARLFTGVLAAWALAIAFFPRFNQLVRDETARTSHSVPVVTQLTGKQIASNSLNGSIK